MVRRNTGVTFVQPLSISVEKAAGIMGIGKTKLYQLIKDNTIRSVFIGRRRLIRVDSVRAFLEMEDGQ